MEDVENFSCDFDVPDNPVCCELVIDIEPRREDGGRRTAVAAGMTPIELGARRRRPRAINTTPRISSTADSGIGASLNPQYE